jgi:biotin transporter BioY
MRDENKPFVMYRRSRWNFSIVPRGTAGWRQFAAWLAVYLVPTIAFSLYAERFEGTPKMWIALALFLAGTMVWSIAGIRWMMARAEVIDVTDMLRQKREKDRRRRR